MIFFSSRELFSFYPRLKIPTVLYDIEKVPANTCSKILSHITENSSDEYFFFSVMAATYTPSSDTILRFAWWCSSAFAYISQLFSSPHPPISSPPHITLPFSHPSILPQLPTHEQSTHPVQSSPPSPVPRCLRLRPCFIHKYHILSKTKRTTKSTHPPSQTCRVYM